MYKTSIALASLLAFADALYLQSSCGPTCCDGGDGGEPNEETQELIDNFIDELDIDGDNAAEEGSDDEDFCAARVDELFLAKGLTHDQSVSADQAIQLINYEYMNDNYSRQKANHWFNLLGRADSDNDNQVTFDDVVAVCWESDGAEFDFEEPADADYLRDHPLDDLVQTMIDLLDTSKNDYINLNYQKNTNIPALLDANTITQEEADLYWEILEGTLETVAEDD